MSDDGWAEEREAWICRRKRSTACRRTSSCRYRRTSAPHLLGWNTDIFDEIDNQSVQADGSSITLGSERSNSDNVEDMIANNRQMTRTLGYYLYLYI